MVNKQSVTQTLNCLVYMLDRKTIGHKQFWDVKAKHPVNRLESQLSDKETPRIVRWRWARLFTRNRNVSTCMVAEQPQTQNSLQYGDLQSYRWGNKDEDVGDEDEKTHLWDAQVTHPIKRGRNTTVKETQPVSWRRTQLFDLKAVHPFNLEKRNSELDAWCRGDVWCNG